MFETVESLLLRLPGLDKNGSSFTFHMAEAIEWRAIVMQNEGLKSTQFRPLFGAAGMFGERAFTTIPLERVRTLNIVGSRTLEFYMKAKQLEDAHRVMLMIIDTPFVEDKLSTLLWYQKSRHNLSAFLRYATIRDRRHFNIMRSLREMGPGGLELSRN